MAAALLYVLKWEGLRTSNMINLQKINELHYLLTESYSKRRKRSAAAVLPVGALVDSKPSRALFAAAMTAPSTSWCQNYEKHRPSAISKAIIIASTQWEELDFEESEHSLAKKLNDGDISAVLQCINAKDTIKKLKLAGCINITGRGLGPLTGSSVLEQIDLSLVGKYEDPDSLYYLPAICQMFVLPILNSIIAAADGCALKYIQFPKDWVIDQSNAMVEFRERYTQLLESRRLCCSKCNESIARGIWLEHDSGLYNEKRYAMTALNLVL